MKIIITIALIGIMDIEPATGQSLRYPVSFPYINLSAYASVQQDPFSFTGNQAALAGVKHLCLGVYSERRFLLSAASAYRFVAAMPSRMGNFGFQLDYAGFKNFNENRLGVAYARKLGHNVDAGIQFNYYGYRIPGYGNASAIYFEGGAIIHLTDKLVSGVQVVNPVGGKLGKTGAEKLASSYRIGLGYEVSDNFFAGGEVIKEEDKRINVITGFQYHFSPGFFARAGIMSESGSGYAGAGIVMGKMRLDISAGYHPQLGLTPGILIMLGF